MKFRGEDTSESYSEKIKMKKITSVFVLAVCLIIVLSLSFISALSITSVSTSPKEVNPGKSFNINVELDNNENNDIENVAVSLNLNNLPFSADTVEFDFDKIREDRSEIADFNLDAFDSATPKEYSIPIQITYYSSDDLTKLITKSAIANIKVNSVPDVEIDVGDNYLIEGQEGKISVKVVNKGIADIKFLEVNMGSISRANLLSSNNVYIGDLNSNDFDTADFTVAAKSGITTSSTSLNVPITLIYRDVFNKEYTQTFDEPVKVYSKSEATKLGLITQNNLFTYILIIVILLVIYLVYRKIRKRMKKKKEASLEH